MDITFLILLLFSIPLMIGFCVLEHFLSRKKNKWPGLILPIFSFLISLVCVFNIASPHNVSMASLWWMILVVFVITNIPTAVLLLIYYLGRKSLAKKDELERMNIQDL